MKGIVTVILGLAMPLAMFAQVQELEQLKLDIEKLVQFKLILSQMKQGYQVLQNGYNSVRDAAKGNFNLHKDYLDGLLNVSPGVKNNPAVKHVSIVNKTMPAEFNAAFQQFSSSGRFTNSELVEIRNAYSLMNEQMDIDMEAVALVLTPGRMRMSDAERIGVIRQIEECMNNRLTGLRELIATNMKIMSVRTQQKRDLDALKKLSGIK